MEGKSILKEDRKMLRSYLLRFQNISKEEHSKLNRFLVHENAWRGLISVIFFVAVEIFRVYDLYRVPTIDVDFMYYWYLGAASVGVVMLIIFLWRFPQGNRVHLQRYLFGMGAMVVLIMTVQEVNAMIFEMTSKENFYCCVIMLLAFSLYPKRFRIVLYAIPTLGLSIAQLLIQGSFGIFYVEIGFLSFVVATLLFNFSCTSELRKIRIELDNQNLKQVAYIDTLTQIQNRRGIEDYINVRLRDGSVEGYLYFIDIDNFKGFNDTYGHNTGDEVLRQVANTLHGVALHRNCKVCRYGGEEFLIVMPFPMEESVASAIGEEIVGNVSKTEIYDPDSKKLLHVTVSVGCSAFQCNCLNDLDEYIKCADEALYSVKQNGKNGFKMNAS